MTKAPRIHNVKRIVFLINSIEKTKYPHMQKMKLDLYTIYKSTQKELKI